MLSGQTGRRTRQTFFIACACRHGDCMMPAMICSIPRPDFGVGARISPEASLQNGSFYYARGQIDGSAYFPASEKMSHWPGRMRLGSIVGGGQ